MNARRLQITTCSDDFERTRDDQWVDYSELHANYNEIETCPICGEKALVVETSKATEYRHRARFVFPATDDGYSQARENKVAYPGTLRMSDRPYGRSYTRGELDNLPAPAIEIVSCFQDDLPKWLRDNETVPDSLSDAVDAQSH